MLLQIDIPYQIIKRLQLIHPGFDYDLRGHNVPLFIDTDKKEELLLALLDELSVQIERDRELLSKIKQ